MLKQSTFISDNQKKFIMRSSAPKKIAKIQFGTMDAKEMALCSEVQVC